MQDKENKKAEIRTEVEKRVKRSEQRKACLVDFDKSNEAIRKRTNAILEREKDGKNEFGRLHAILCMTHGWDTTDSIALDNFIDSSLIAKRMDEIYTEIGKKITN